MNKIFILKKTRNILVIFSPGPEKAIAEKLGIGVITGWTFTLKHPPRDNVRDICIPNASKKDIMGIITHVSLPIATVIFQFFFFKFRFFLDQYSLFLYLIIYFTLG